MMNSHKPHVIMRLHAFPNLSETFILNQIQHLLKKDVELHILVDEVIWSRMNELCLSSNIHFHQITKTSLRVWLRTLLAFPNWLYLNTLSLFRNQKWVVTALPANLIFDIYHCQYATYIKEAVDLKTSGLLKYKHLVSSGRGYDVTSELIAHPENVAPYLPSLSLYLPVSQSLAKPIANLGFPIDKIAVLHSGIDLTLFENVKKNESQANRKKLVSVGRLVEKKGILDSIAAVQSLLKDGYNLTYDIYGDGPLYRELAQFIESNNLSSYIKLHGATAHHQALESIRQADLFLLHCKTASNGNSEGIPNVLKEAMLLDVLVATTKHSGIEELFGNEYLDYLAAEGDIAEITQKLVALLNLDEDQKKDLLATNRKRIQEDFDIVQLTDQLYEHYRSLIN
jgi:colanic acid/amylovoran biosynthesis glycosyltransferase